MTEQFRELSVREELEVRWLAVRLHKAYCQSGHVSPFLSEKDCGQQYNRIARRLFLEFPLGNIEETIADLEKKRQVEQVLQRLQNLLDE